MRFAPIARIGLLFVLALSAMGQDAPNASVAGTWEHKGADGETITFTLNPDGSAKIDDEAARYTVAGDTISVVIDGETIRYTFKIEGDSMTVSGGDLDRPTTFSRKGPPSAPKRGLGAKIKLGAGDAKNEPAKSSPFDVAGALTGEAKPAHQPAAAPTLVGKWQADDGSELSFTEQHFKFGGRDIPYKAADGTITLTGPKGQIQWPYELSGDQLTLTLEGNKQTLKRVGAAPIAGAADQKPAPAPFGTWAADDGDKIEIRENAIVYQGTAIPAKDTGSAIRITFQGQTMDWPYELTGDSLKLTIGGQPLALKRVGAPPVVEPKKGEPAAGADAGAANAAPPDNDPKSLVGVWDGPDGTVTVRADGTTRSGGQDFKWSADASAITLSDDKNWVKIPYKLQGDKLVLGTGPTKTLTRNKGGLAGVWVAQESSLDPQFFMSVTQYVTLFPNGAVGFAKSEGGATRTAISQHLERFSSFQNNQDNAGKTYGRWQQDGDTVNIQWQGAFNNATWQGRINPKNGKLVIPRAGILKEGDTLEYERQ